MKYFIEFRKKLPHSEKCVHYLWHRIVLNAVRFKSLWATVLRPFISALYSILKGKKCALNLQLAYAFIQAVNR